MAMTNETLCLRRKVMMKKSMFVLLLVCGLLLSVFIAGLWSLVVCTGTGRDYDNTGQRPTANRSG